MAIEEFDRDRAVADLRRQSEIIRNWQKFAEALAKILGCPAMDTEILKAVKVLDEQNDFFRERMNDMIAIAKGAQDQIGALRAAIAIVAYKPGDKPNGN